MFDQRGAAELEVAEVLEAAASLLRAARGETDGEAPSGAELSELLERGHRVLAAIDGALLAAVRPWVSSGDWAEDGSLTPASWLVSNTGCRRVAAGSTCQTAARLAHLPRVADATARGVLPRSHVELLARTWTKQLADLFARDEAELVALARALTADALRDELARRVLGWLEELHENESDGTPPPGGVDDLRLDRAFQGRGVLRGEFGAEATGVLSDSLDAEIDQMFHAGELADDTRSRGELRAEALLRIVARGAQANVSRGRPRPLVVASASLLDLFDRSGVAAHDRPRRHAEILNGGPVATAAVRAMLCGADLSIVLTDANGEPLYVGRSERHATAAQFRGLITRSGGRCEFPDCDVGHTWCIAHHLDPYEHGGRTDIDNSASRQCVRRGCPTYPVLWGTAVRALHRALWPPTGTGLLNLLAVAMVSGL